VACALIAARLVAGLLAAAFGIIDWLAVARNTRAKRSARCTAGATWGAADLRHQLPAAHREAASAARGAVLLSARGVALSLLTAWVGGELVDRLGVGVSPHAHLDARSSPEGPAEPQRERADVR
jgi:uncharacterized membrane protein